MTLKYLLFFVGIISICLFFNKISIEKDNDILQKKVLDYYSAISQENFQEAELFYHPNLKNEARDLLLNTKYKMEVLGCRAIRIKKVFPAYIVGDLAIIGFELETKNVYNEKAVVLQELGSVFFEKENNEWYLITNNAVLAKNREKINDMIDNYNLILKENIRYKPEYLYVKKL